MHQWRFRLPAHPRPEAMDTDAANFHSLQRLKIPPRFAWAVSDSLRCLYCGPVPYVVFDSCTACQECALVCPVECIARVALNSDNSTREIEGPTDIIVYEISGEECIRCGRCFGACPARAIVVEGFTWH